MTEISPIDAPQTPLARHAQGATPVRASSAHGKAPRSRRSKARIRGLSSFAAALLGDVVLVAGSGWLLWLGRG